jgi:hypothetical protein
MNPLEDEVPRRLFEDVLAIVGDVPTSTVVARIKTNFGPDPQAILQHHLATAAERLVRRPRDISTGHGVADPFGRRRPGQCLLSTTAALR